MVHVVLISEEVIGVDLVLNVYSLVTFSRPFGPKHSGFGGPIRGECLL